MKINAPMHTGPSFDRAKRETEYLELRRRGIVAGEAAIRVSATAAEARRLEEDWAAHSRERAPRDQGRARCDDHVKAVRKASKVGFLGHWSAKPGGYLYRRAA